MGALYLVALTNFFAALPAAPGSIGTFDAAVIFGAQGARRQRLGRGLVPAAAALRALRARSRSSGSWCSSPATAAGRACARPPGSRRAAPSARAPTRAPRSTAPLPCAMRALCRTLRRVRAAAAGRGRALAGERRSAGRGCRCGGSCWAAWWSPRSRCSSLHPTYDPWAWIMWGREITQLDLVTRAAPPGSRCRSSSPPRSRCSATTWRPTCGCGSPAPAALLACVMAFRMARRLIGGGWYGPLAGAFGGARAVLELQVRARRGARQLRGAAGRARAVGLRAPPRRPPRPRALPRLRRRAAAPRGVALPRRSTGSGSGSPSRGCDCAWSPSPRSSRRSGSCPSGGARATRSAPARAPTTPTRAAPRSPSLPALELLEPLPQGRDRARSRSGSSSPRSTRRDVGHAAAREGADPGAGPRRLRLVRARGRR